MSIYAILIDVVSIQRYVFGSNKLKENLGSSFLIQEIYQSYLQKVVKKIFPSHKIDFDSWKNDPSHYLIKDSNIHFDIGYIGGGNALLFFKDKARAENFIKKWTKTLLVETPGIVTAVVCDKFNLDDSEFKRENKSLFRNLQENKYKFITQTVIPRHGITAECSHTGYSMEIWNDKVPEDEQNYVSSVAYAKNKAAKDANAKLEEDFATELGSQYCFTDQLDKLGQSKGEDSHIAIVHIDGNEMGKRFRETELLGEIRSLSTSVRDATQNTFKKLLESIISNFSNIEKEVRIQRDKDNGRKILPLRPIIIGGDDITFVCDGRLGIYFAKTFMESFEAQKDKDGKDLNLTACAGIAITKTKYPFYRGYELSEDLCKNAKEIRKKNGKTGSWLDFHIAYGGFSGRLKEIRNAHYRAEGGCLLMRPYHIGENNDELSFETLIKNTKDLLWRDKGKRNFPRSKIIELRKVITLGEEARRTFVQEIEARGRKLPKIQGHVYEDTLFENLKTPYFDMVELVEVYPGFELEN